MAKLAPTGAPPPAYAVGVAYPALRLILLSMVTPDKWLPPDLDAVYTHELSHVALHEAVGERVALVVANGEDGVLVGDRERGPGRVRAQHLAQQVARVVELALVGVQVEAAGHRPRGREAQVGEGLPPPRALGSVELRNGAQRPRVLQPLVVGVEPEALSSRANPVAPAPNTPP